jgi:hypothetical protein
MYRRVAHPAFLASLADTLELVVSRGHKAIVSTVEGCCYVQFARNRLVWEFLKSDAEALFFLDDDVSWEAQDALALIEHPDAVIAGIYRIKKDAEEYPVVIYSDANNRPVVFADGTISACGVPAGMLRIHRSVIEKLVHAHPEKRYYDFINGSREEGFYDLFPQGVYGDRWVGEDMAFCQLWRDLGGRISILPNMTLGHHAGDKQWAGNYHQFLLRQPGGSLANEK